MLGLGLRQSCRVIGSDDYGARISSDHVWERVNAARRHLPCLDYIPHDLQTVGELAEEFAESEITAHEIVLWSKRLRNPLPHLRFNKQTRRFRRSDLEAWLNARCAKTYYS